MTINLLQTPEYIAQINEHIFQTISYLFQKNQEFAIVCEIKNVDFQPELPTEIKEEMLNKETALFMISNYTLQSATVNESTFTFEAGFGAQNYGSLLTIPLLGIKYIYLGETLILVNASTYEKKTTRSMKDILNSPKNKKLVKKK
jgi:hypothetical protein